jgi:hypothetical protein
MPNHLPRCERFRQSVFIRAHQNLQRRVDLKLDAA